MRFLKGKGWLCHGRPLDAQPPDIGFIFEPAFQKNTQFGMLVGEKSSPFIRFIQGLALAFLFLGFSFSSFSQVNKGEYFFDTDPGIGNGFNLTVSSAADSITINQNVSISGLSAGFHTLFVRTRMSKKWSQTESRGFFITSSTSLSSGPVSQLEYFFDTDPGVGLGTKINLTVSADSVERSTAIPIGSLSAGFHTIYIRAKNNRGYSMTESRSFFITSSSASTAGPISQLEYFFDTDPGVGLGTKLTVSPSADSSERTAIIPISSLSSGFHTMYVRAKNNRGYSMTESRSFFITSSTASTAGPITQLEYFFDADPGIGLGTKITISPSADSTERTAVIPISSLSSGFHTMYIRAKNNRGYSMTESRSFFIVPASSFTAGPVTKMEYFIDTDPGVGSGTPISTFTAGDSVEVTRVITLPSNIAIGAHKFYVRSQTTDKRWSITEVKDFNVACGETFVSATQTVICPGQTTVLSLTAGNLPGTYQWIRNGVAISGANAFSFTATQTGTYKLRYENGSCIDTSDAVVIGSGAGVTATATAAGPVTFCTGSSVTLNANNGTGFSHQWLRNNAPIGGQTSPQLAGVNTAGSYSVIVTNATGCKDTSNVILVTINPKPNPAITPTQTQNLCAGNNVPFSLINPVNGQTYQWKNGNTVVGSNSSFSATVSGNYKLVVTNSSGCKDSSGVVAVNIVPAPVATVTPTGPVSICSTSSITLTVSATTGTTITWLKGKIAISGQTGNTLLVSSAGSYSAVATLSGGCTDTSNVVVVNLGSGTPATATASGPTTFCQGGSVNINANSGTGLSYVWQRNAVDIGGQTNVQLANVGISGAYRVITTNASNCKDTSNVVSVTVNPLPNASVSPAGPISVCLGTPTSLSVSNPVSGQTYQWKNGNAVVGTNSPNLSISVSGSYKVLITNSSNCKDSSGVVQVTVSPVPAISISPIGPITLCQGDSRNLTATVSNGASIKWLRNETPISGQIATSFSAILAGTYKAVATVGTCSDTSNAVVVNVNPKPAPVVSPAGPVSICANGSAVLSLSNPVSGQSVQWKNNGVPLSGTNSISVSTDGFYYVVSTINSTGCKDSSAAVTVNVVNPQVSPAGPVQICQGGSTNLTVSNIGTATVKWLRNEVEISGVSSQILSATLSGTYKAVATIAGVCSDTSNGVFVNVNALPTAGITADADSFCVGGRTVLRANQGPGLTYQWKNNGGNIANANADTLLVSTSGSYTVEVKNAANCPKISNAISIRSVNNITWFLDVDGDGYSAGVTASSCTRPQNGFLPSELTATSGDCNDLDGTINPSRQFFSFVGTSGFESALCSPLQGTPYTNFRFEVVYTDLNNNPPPVTFPRVILDFEGNGNLNGPNDRTILMQEFDNKDKDYANGKRYFATINSLPSGLNYTTRIVSNIGTCGALIGPANYPDVFILSDIQIFANDITFDNVNPPVSSNLQVTAKINNVSDFAAQNFVVHLVNQYDTTIIYPDIIVPFLAPQSSTTVTWNIITPSVPAWCPMKVTIDYTKVIQETNELDNTAIRPFINGNFNVPGSITFSPSVVPSTIVGVSGATGTLTGSAVYTGTAVPLQNPSVAGAQVSFTIQPGGQTYTTYTNSGGFINFSFFVGLTPGTYTISGTITDFTLTSNFTLTFVVVPPVCLPDLTALLTVSSNNIVEGESINGNLRITNQGCQNVTDSTLVKFSQSGGTPTLPDVKIPPLAIGQSFNIPFTNLVFNTPGTFSVCGQADGNFIINEAAEFNNQDCEIITVIPFLPDIYPINCGVGGQQFITGQPSTISLSLYNSGGSATGPFNTRVILSREGVPVDTIDQLISNLGRQSGTSFSFEYTYPSPGTYSLSVYCDNPAPNGVVVETDETNNTSNCGILILATRPDLAFIGGCDDLKVLPTDPAFPGTHTIRARVGNSGNAVAIAPILVRFTLSGGTIIEETITNSIPAGQSVLISKTYAGVAPATQTVSAVIDPNSTVAEFSKLNNVVGPKSLCHEFAPVDNNCGGTWWTGTYLKNQAIFLNVPVWVQGAYRASQLKTRFFVSGPGLTGTLNLGDAILTDVTESCVCPTIATLPVSFAFPEEGEYTFTMVTDPDNQYTECNETNNTIVRKVQVSGLPDMRVLSQLINPSKLNPDVNEPIIIQANYENIGLSNIDQTMKFKVLIDEIAHDSATVNGLVTGDNFTVNFTKPWSSDLVGSHIIRTIIDADNVIVESTKSNNEATRAVIVGAAANMFFQVFLPNNSSPNIGQSITVNTRIGNNGDEDVEGVVQLFYINNQGDTIQIGQAPVSVAANDSTILNFPWLVVDNSTTLIGKIVNANIMEFNYDDNQATASLGLFNVTLTSTPACAGQINGTLTASPTGGTGPFLYVWSNGFIGQTFTNGPGNYSVTVTDALGVSVLVSGSIPNIPGVRYFADADGDGYGNASIDLIDCTKPDGFVQNNLDCNDNNPAIYKATPIPVVNNTGSLTFCAGGSTTLSTPVLPGTAFLWSTNVTGSSILVGAAGSYTVSATLDSGCTSTSLPVVVTVLTSITPTASISASPDSVICNGTSVTFSSNISGGGDLPSLEWYLNDLFVEIGPSYTSDTLKEGDKIQLILTSDESCASPVSVLSNAITMTVGSSLQANAGSDQTICETTVNLVANSTGTWSKLSGTGVITNPGTAATTVTNLSPGINEFIWTTSGGNCQPSSDTVVITVTDPPTQANAGPDQTICSNSTTLAGNVPQSGIGSWQILSGTGVFVDLLLNTTDVGGLSTGENKLLWTIGKSGCQLSVDTVVINVSEPLTISNPGGNPFICEDSIQLNASIPTRGIGTWTVISGTGIFENINLANSKVKGLSTGDNVFQWTISDGLCPDASVTATVNVNSGPSQSNAGQDQAVCVPSTLLQAQNPLVGTGVWRLVSGSGTFVDSLDRTSLVNDLSVGQNQFVWVVRQATCSPTSDTVSITYNLPPDVSIAGNDQQICGDSAQLSANVPLVGTGVWDLISGSGSFDNAGSASTTIRGLGIGENKVRWSISTATCGSRADTVVLTVIPGPSQANAGTDQSVCEDSVLVQAQIPLIGTGTWSLLSGSGNIQGINSAGTTINALGVGVNQFVWTVTNGNCPSDADTISITRIGSVGLSNAGPDQTTCDSNTVMEANTPGVGVGSWTLFSGTGTILNPSSPNTPVNNLGVGTNVLIWTLSNGICAASSDTVIVVRQAAPGISLAGEDQNICSTQAILNGNVPAIGTGLWTIVTGSGTVSNPTLANAVVSGLNPGNTVLEWAISNGSCLVRRDTVVLSVSTPPSQANAGTDQSVCEDSVLVQAQIPLIGTGTWSLLSGSGNIQGINSAGTTINALGVGVNQFVWTVTNGNCPSDADTISITRIGSVGLSNAGPDQTTCDSNTVMEANTPGVGVGSWTLFSGTGTILNPSSPNTPVNNLGVGTNVLIWTLSNGICAASSDTVIVVRQAAPGISLAGEDQNICSTQATLNGNVPAIGTGLWTIVTGSGTVSNPALANAVVSGLNPGNTVLEWAISNGSCLVRRDTVVLSVGTPPSQANAGPDQLVCGTAATLAANAPTVGNGTWTLVSGSGNLTNALSPNSGVTELNAGQNVFVWNITNGTCPVSTDTVLITSSPGLTAVAGNAQTVCGDSVQLGAVKPAIGVGRWELVSGTGLIAQPDSANTKVFGLTTGSNTFRWIVSNVVCPSDTDLVAITSVSSPSPALVGASQNVCGTTATLSATTVTTGVGSWSLVSGSGIISDTLSVNPVVTNLGIGANVFRWTVRNAPCPANFDQVTFTGNPIPVANAGADRIACNGQVILQAITASGVTGNWIQTLGTGSIVSAGEDTTLVTGLVSVVNQFVWIANLGNCASSDTVNVVLVSNSLLLGRDTTICVDSSIVLNAGTGFVSYLWSTGSSDSTITVSVAGTYFVEIVTSQGCSFRDSIVINVAPCTAVKPALMGGPEISVYPNPFRNKIQLEIGNLTEREVEYKLISSTGVEVHSGKAISDSGKLSKEITPGKLPNGFYILELSYGDSVFRKKLILE